MSVAVCLSFDASAAGRVLFPSPLHLTRELTNPITGTKAVIDEYCHGNRIVSVSGGRTAIADYEKGELTAIDFTAGTYSITKFGDIARTQRTVATMAAPRDEWNVEARGGRVIASRPGVELEAKREQRGMRQVIRVTADSQVRLSRGAVEALLGYAWPNPPDASADVVLGALRDDTRRIASNSAAAAAADDDYRLPLEHTMHFEAGNDVIETRNVVMRVGTELPPADVLAIPPGARLVELPSVAARRELEQLDRPAPRP